MTRRVGSVVYCTEQGLGRLAKSFYDNGIFTEVYIKEHHCRLNRFEWYPPGTPVVPSHSRDYSGVHRWVESLDTLLIFETPFDWNLISTAHLHGVRVVFMPMYECTPEKIPVEPDLWICPSALDYDYFQKTNRAIYTPVPVDVPYRRRTVCRHFVHNAGNGGLRGRNGSWEVWQALQLVKKPVEFTFRIQDSELAETLTKFSPPVPGHITFHYEVGTVPYENLWSTGDVFVFPEKFNGLSLPLQEAYASGMIVLATDRYPNNVYLPRQTLMTPTEVLHGQRVGGSYMPFTESTVNAETIAKWIDDLYDMDLSDQSDRGFWYAQKNSWNELKPRYLEIL